MSLLAALVLAAASARVDSVYMTTTTDQRLAIRVALTGTPGMVAVHREGAAARVSVMEAALGGQFAGGRHFSWTPTSRFDPTLLASTPVKLDRLEIAGTDTEVSVLLHVPPEVAVDVRRDARGLLLVFRSALPQEAAPSNVAQAASPVVAQTVPPPAPVVAQAVPPPVAAPAPTPPAERKPEPAPVVPAAPKSEPAPVPTPAGATSSPATADLAKQLFPTAPSEGQPAVGSVAELYPQLFPSGTPAKEPEAERGVDVSELGPDEGAVLGPFRVRAAVDARYVDADTFIESSAEPTRDNYLEVQPRVLAAAPVGAGALRLEYSPVFRAFATFDQVNSSSHLLGAGLELPVGARVTLRARDRFQSGVLDTRVVDPGGEYFFGLGRFNRNDVDAGASIVVGPRTSVELAGTAGTVHFTEPSSFFDYDTRSASAGLGFELTPRLRAILDYVYDRVPTNDERPEAESTAHGARLSLNGELLPLLTGELSVGYRQQDSPNAGEGGTRYSGLTLRAALTRELGRDSNFAIYANRSTPLSAYQENGFYVATGVQGVLTLALAGKFEARGGLGYQSNDYRTIAPEIGASREDRILGWFVGLRRPIARKLALSAAYRDENRDSNINDLDTDANGFYITLEWDLFGTPPR
jgi:Putative beta-barrel porin 2